MHKCCSNVLEGGLGFYGETTNFLMCMHWSNLVVDWKMQKLSLWAKLLAQFGRRLYSPFRLVQEFIFPPAAQGGCADLTRDLFSTRDLVLFQLEMPTREGNWTCANL